jgi:FG-GAP repeat
MRYRLLLAVPCLFALSLCASAQPGVTVTELGQFSGSDLPVGARFGYSTVISGDGNTMAVGAPYGNTGYAGEIYVFEKPSTGWGTTAQTARLNPTSQCLLGYAIAISSDGSTIVSSASQSSGCEGGTATFWIDVFVRPAGGWQDTATPTAVLSVPNNGLNTNFGLHLALSASGKTVIGEVYLPSVGKTYLEFFDEPSGGWTSMSPSSSFLAPFGNGEWPLAINGSTISLLDPNSNAVRVYQRGSTGLVQVATLTPSDGQPFYYITLAADTQTILVQGWSGTNQQGKVYLYSKPSTGWATATETAQLSVSGIKSTAGLGSTISISGKNVLVGGTNALAAYLFIEPAGGWVTTATPDARLTSSDPNKKNFGNSVYIVGTTMIVGDYLAGASDSAVGAAYVYSF